MKQAKKQKASNNLAIKEAGNKEAMRQASKEAKIGRIQNRLSGLYMLR